MKTIAIKDKQLDDCKALYTGKTNELE
jgi:hypothetical protein